MVALCLMLAACGTTTTGSPPQVGRSPDLATRYPCPSTAPAAVPTPSDTHLGGPVPPHPGRAQLCAVGAKGTPPAGVVLASGAARAVAYLINTAPAARQGWARCGFRYVSLLIRLWYSPNTFVDVPIVYACGQSIASTNVGARVLATKVTDVLQVASEPESLFGGEPVPDLYGDTIRIAETIAARHRLSVNFAAEAVDPQVPAGTVLLQTPPAGSPSPDGIDVVVAVRPEPDCNVRQLALTYYSGGVGTGNDFANIGIRDVSDEPCRLPGPVLLTGISAGGTPVTRTLAYPTSPDLVLTALAAPVPAGQTAPAEEIVAELPLSADVRDDPIAPNGLCRLRIVPAIWRVRFSNGTLTVANVSQGPLALPRSLATCRGELNVASTITAE